MESYALYALVVAFAALGAISLFFRAESIRGLGRVAQGLSMALVAVMVFHASTGESADYLTAILALSGLITMLAGLRKFVRRNLT